MGRPLAVQLARLDMRIEREIHRLRARYQLSLDEFRGLYVSDEQVDRLIAYAGDPFEGATAPILMDRPAAGIGEYDPQWRRLVDTFSLSPLDEDLLLIGGAPELDPRYEILYAYLNNDVARKWPTVDLARRLLDGVADGGAVLGALAPGARLRLCHLVEPIDSPASRPALLNAGYALHPCVALLMHGRGPALALDGNSILWTPVGEWPESDHEALVRAEPIVRAISAAHVRAAVPPLVALLGPTGSGRSEIAAAIAAALGRPFVRLDLRALPTTDENAAAVLNRLSVALRLDPAVVLVDGFGSMTEDERRDARHEARFARALAQWPASVPVLFRTNEDERWRACVGSRRFLEQRCGVEVFSNRVRLWKDAAVSENVGLPEDELKGLAGRFSLSPGHVRATFATAWDLAAMKGEEDEVDVELVAAAARLASDQTLGRLAAKVERRHEWKDLVLPAPTLRRLHDLAAAIRHRQVVYSEWGFGERLVTGTGIKALFAGSSGTGKTMAAGVIARELGLDAYKIDLSGVVSKYIGETEKNLDRIFRAARAANAIVFLDEAEALMGKRSDVKDAHDRYANIEVAYLLQKIEEHDGIVILATNLKRNIDDAFNRRMQYVIDFPRPDDSERERIWRGMFPSRSPLHADVDFTFLARQFDLSGGEIRNVVLDAAFLAVQDGGVIDMTVIVEALARQLAKQGKTPTGNEFRQYQQLLLRAEGPRDGK